MKQIENKVILQVRHLCKFFDGVKAVNNVDLELCEGEIIAIVGDNGAGKSTLIKMLSGVYRKDHGEFLIDGQKAVINSPFDARKCGIATVYQDEGLIHHFDITQNLFLGRMKRQDGLWGKLFGFVDHRYMRKETESFLNKMGIGVCDAKTRMEHLSGGQRQAVKVGKAVYWGGRILIFDEPTNNLSVMQEKTLIDLIRRYRDGHQVAVVVISHNIGRLFELADRFVVLRNGKIVGQKRKLETTPNEIVAMMTGATQ